MNSKKLFLVGIMTAMMLSPASAYAYTYTQGNVKSYYKSIMRYEMKDLTEEERISYLKEILDQEVENGIITRERAELELEDLKKDCIVYHEE